MLRKLIATMPTWITVPLRFAMGIIFIAHGGGKVFGWFGGKGLHPFLANNTPPFGFMKPAWLWMGASAFAELIGGILVLTGLLTRVGAFLIICVMLTAMFGVHWGAFFAPQGIEYTLALMGMALALLIAGGGLLSLDQILLNARGRRR